MEGLEIWKDIEGFCGFYKINSYFEIRSIARITIQKNDKIYSVKDRILKQCIDDGGYLCIKLRKDKKTITVRVHRIIAKTFIPNPNNYPCVNHKDGNKMNNSIENLEWCTYAQNTQHAIDKLGAKMGKYSGTKEVREKISSGLKEFFNLKNNGNKCRHGHEYTPENLLKRKDGARACRICANLATKRSRGNRK